MSAVSYVVFQDAPARRLPGSVVASIAAHAAVLGLWLYATTLAQKETLRVISNVDFMVQVRKPVAAPRAAAARKAQSTFDFLKMALPSIPKIEPKRLEVKIPEPKRNLMKAEAKLLDRGKIAAGPKLEELELASKRPEIAKIEAKTERRSAATLAQMPRLEEIGRRKVSDLPAALALEEKRQEALQMQRLDALSKVSERRAAAPALESLREAAPPAGGSKVAAKLADLLPEKLDLKPQVAAAPVGLPKAKFDAPAASTRKQAGPVEAEKKKGVEIEGPLADRKVVAYSIPEFPNWAKEQGVLEASVSIRFWVSKDGEVLQNMRIEHTSGYGRLDRLAMDSLKAWRFAPLLAEERQWGVITFRFLLE